jgi:outer membrane protein
MTINRYLLLLVFCLQLYAVQSQPESSGKAFTLDQCVSYALENSIGIKNANIDERIASAKVKETRGIGLPQVNGSVALRHNQKLPRFFATKQTVFGFSGLPEEEYANFLPGVPDDAVVASPNFFQLKGSGDAGLSINQLLFNSSYLVGLKAANAYRDLSIRTSEQTQEEIIQKVTQAYYLCLINKDRVELYNNNIARVDTLLRNTTAQFENGLAESIDVDRTKVSLTNLTVERNTFIKLQEVALQALKLQMNYPMDQPLVLEGDIASIQLDESALSNYELDWDYTQRTDYRILEANRKLQTLNIKNKYAESMPSLSGFVDLGYSTQSPNISGLFKTNTNISDNGLIGPDKWYPYSAFGITLNIPLFSGLQRTYVIQQEKLEMMKIENNFIALKSGIDLEIKQAAANFLNAVESMKAQEQNQKLAENVARVTKIKYEEGVGSNLEVVQAETDLRESQINYYNAVYDALVAKLDLDKSYGKLLNTDTSKN